jgi:glycerophosphoryl diester phosphodiesterase
MMGLACWALQACNATEVASTHNLRDGDIMTVVHGCGGFETYRNTLPPNTIAAAERSIAQGADAIELDVQLSADGQLVAFHDGLLEKNTGCRGCIGDMAAADVIDCRYQTRYHSLDGIHRIPLLDSLLAAIHAANPAATIFINTKHESPCDSGNFNGGNLAFATALAAAIDRQGLADQVIIESMGASFLLNMRAVAPALPLLFDDEDYERGMQTVRTHQFLGLAISNGQVTEAQVRQAHAEGYWLGIWGVKVLNDTRKAVRKGPEFIMTDDLQMLQSTLKQ